MDPIEFPEQNTVWKPSQQTHRPLPAYVDVMQTISLWRLSWRERLQVFWSGRLWLRQCNYGEPLQPQLIQVESPFVRPLFHSGAARSASRVLNH